RPANAGRGCDGRPGDGCGSPAHLPRARRGNGPGARRRSWLSRRSACAAWGHSQSLRHETRLVRGSSGAVLEAPAFVAGLDDVAVMGEAVEQRGRHFRIAEDARPFAEGEVGRDDDRGALIETADEMEQQLPAGLGEGEIAEFVEDHEVEAREVIGEPSLAAGARLSLELIDEIDGGEEAAARSRADAAPRDGDRPVSLARSGRDSDTAPGVWRVR